MNCIGTCICSRDSQIARIFFLFLKIRSYIFFSYFAVGFLSSLSPVMTICTWWSWCISRAAAIEGRATGIFSSLIWNNKLSSEYMTK